MAERGRPTSCAFIYALVCPVSKNVMYVGKANDPHKRFKQHLRDCKRGGSAKDRWVRRLQSGGALPDMVILEETVDWPEAEKRWIAHYGGPALLLNVSSGGVVSWADKGKRAGKWHRKVIARFLEISKQGDDERRRFLPLANAYRKLRDDARLVGMEDQYEAHLERHFAAVFA